MRKDLRTRPHCDIYPLGQSAHRENKNCGIFATFLRLGALLGSFRLEICHFCCVFVPRFAIEELAAIANRKKVAIRTDSLFLGSWEGPRGSAGMLWARCGTGVEPDTVLGRCGPDAERGWIWRGVGLTRCSAKALPGCGIVMLPHCRARELFGRGIVMWPERGVAKHGRCRGFGRLLVYRVVLLLSLKISNATLLKLVFRYNGRREFVEEQARSPPYEQSFGYP